MQHLWTLQEGRTSKARTVTEDVAIKGIISMLLSKNALKLAGSCVFMPMLDAIIV